MSRAQNQFTLSSVSNEACPYKAVFYLQTRDCNILFISRNASWVADCVKAANASCSSSQGNPAIQKIFDRYQSICSKRKSLILI